MKIFTKDNVYAALFSAFVLAGLALVSTQVSHAESAGSLTRSNFASGLVSAMPEARELTARKIPQINVQCELDKSASDFHVQIEYWQDGHPETLQTNEPCAQRGPVMTMLPEEDGWHVKVAASDSPITFEDVVRGVATDSISTTH